MLCDWCKTGRRPSQYSDSPVPNKLVPDQSQGALEGNVKKNVQMGTTDIINGRSGCFYYVEISFRLIDIFKP